MTIEGGTGDDQKKKTGPPPQKFDEGIQHLPESYAPAGASGGTAGYLVLTLI
ncbi:hypothetical protein KQI74_21130 [Paenibacillus barcinonensis]|jgi:hypothetical protein|uniref:hypothetical protein n=1 Tax=Paenibacillus barcinonensis TaxID=198119 RepID=UPI001C0FF318|nr:hypothetical protein [Paenibacillus barcinonensis]MBU5354803.1 hypothetical protein [Paenibacillus barcinonensis]MDM5275871.1 hypothetical protein [Paenibacillus silvae]